MFNKILIANRGEIACRIIKTAKRMGVATVAVYSDADRDAMHVQLADEAVHIGPAAASESYLRADKILQAASDTGAQAIHPGYGFMSENAGFCRSCEQQGIVFIGPPVGAIESMGSKSASKMIMSEAKVPLLPGYHGDDQDDALLKAEAAKIGYPVLLKASAGGGGKGMRIIWEAAEFDTALAATRREASNAFGDDKMLVEKFLTGPRHVEIQVFCDNHGNAVHLFERDCSLQRRHQKVIEEAPAPGMTQTLRAAMGHAAVQAAATIGYRGAGTVEFLLNSNGEFYFMEMNTRLQVEHPVTEMICQQDLVEWQLRVASGEPLPLTQDQLSIHGHAFEARIYAEDADNNFLPQTGTLNFFHNLPESDDLRLDSGVRQGDEVSVNYDPMIAKLVVWGEDRQTALQKLQRALAHCCIDGVITNTKFLSLLASDPEFVKGQVDTNFIDNHYQEILDTATAKKAAAAARNTALAALCLLLQEQSRQGGASTPWSSDGWRTNLAARRQLSLLIGDQRADLTVENLPEQQWRITTDDETLTIGGKLVGSELVANINGQQARYRWHQGPQKWVVFTDTGPLHFSRYQFEKEADDHHGGLVAPMNGRVVCLSVEAGTGVKKGDVLMIMEAMKMEHSITAAADGTVDSFHFAAGDLVEGGANLLEFSATENTAACNGDT